MALLASRDISTLFLAVACVLIATAGYYFVTLLGFLSLQTSITELQISDSKVSLVDGESGKKEYELAPHPILNQYFCILSFGMNKFDALSPSHPFGFLQSPYRHVILSRYNIEDIAGFRQARVKLRFLQPSQLAKSST